MMNGYDEKRHLDEDAFGAKGSIVSAFDAFRMPIPPPPQIPSTPN
jgi:hypothetical protein